MDQQRTNAIQGDAMSQFFSDKLRLVSFLAIVIVFYIHSNTTDVAAQAMLAPAVARKTIAGVLGPCAVPMFYAISGFLFFRGIKRGLFDIFKKMKKRVWTLLIPFVIAAIVYLLQPMLKQALLHTPSDNDYLQMISHDSLLVTLRNLFYDSGTGMPWAYHLWFMRDLIIIVALSPLLYYLRRYLGYWLMALAVALYVVFPQISFLYSMCWFVAGSLVLGRLSLPRWAVAICFVAFMALAVFHQIVDYSAWQYVRIVETSLGLVSLWSIYDWLVLSTFRLSNHKWLALACQFTFFMYLYHEPTLHTTFKAITASTGYSELGYTLAILVTPLIVAPLMLAVGYAVKRFLPSVYRVMVGGR